MIRLLLFSLCFLGCHSLKKLQKESVRIEKKESKVSHKKDSIRSVFTEKRRVVLEDTGRIITYELALPASIKDIINGSALVHKVTIEEKKLNQKTHEEKQGQATAVRKQKDSADIDEKQDITKEISIKKEPKTWSVWLWIVGGIIVFIVLVVFRKYIAIINPLKYIRR